jgi:hypothetical protein
VPVRLDDEQVGPDGRRAAGTIDWRFISLRLINSHLDYGSHFPAG